MKVAIAHDFEHLLPALSDAELAQLEANCQADPNHERMPPVVVWSNHKNTIVDGHNQHRIRERLRLKVKFCKMEFESRDEAKRYALDVQFGRRNLDASQRAIAYAKLPRKPEGKPNSNMANLPCLDELAEAAGTSKRTMQAAVKVVDHAPSAVVKAVESGAIKVSDAAAVAELPKSDQTAALKAVQAGEARTMREAAEKPETQSEEVEDCVGQRVPDKLRAVFDCAEQFEQQSRTLAAVKKWATATAELPFGSYLHLQSFAGLLNAAQKQLKFERPFAVCPYCQAKNQKCAACKGRGFVTKPLYESAPSELRI